MGWSSALRRTSHETFTAFTYPTFPKATVDWDRLVVIDFESYWDTDYTLKKLSTSEYVRDPRFKAQMMAIKVGGKPTRIIPHHRIAAELAKINWATHSVLCHNAQFDGFILSHRYGVVPCCYYDTLSMARGLHSNEIGAGLDEVAKFYGGVGKIDGVLEKTKGVLNWPKALYDEAAVYCAQDNDECFRIFREMWAKYPADEMELIDLTIRMFCDPVLKVDLPRVEKELKRELDRREVLFQSVLSPADFYDQKLLKGAEKQLPQPDQDRIITKRVLGSNERFAELLRAEGIEPPVKISPAWAKKNPMERHDEDKWAYAFAKDDLAFTSLPDKVDVWGADLDLNDPDDVKIAAEKQERIRTLVDCRIAVKSTTNITRAERFITAGANGMSLPCGYAYYRAHCLTGDAQVLTRTGWVRLDEWHGSEIAQWLPGGEMRFAAATPNEFNVNEDLVVASSRYHCARYTMGHTVPTLTSTGRFVDRQAGALQEGCCDIPISGALDGDAAITVLDAQIAAMVQADGNVRTDVSNGRCVRLGFRKARKIERCTALLNEAGVPFKQSVDSEGSTRIFVGAADMHKVLGLVDDAKEFLSPLLNAPLHVKIAFLDELTHWDGDIEPHGKGFTYSTTNEANAEMVQTIAHMSGQSAYMSSRARGRWAKSYRVYIRKDQKTRSEPKHYSTQRHVGKVYCPTTETGYFLMRQNGHIVVTGNTGRWGGNNKMNMQNLTRKGELRLSILAAKGHQIAVQDSGQIEARVNAWLWGQDDLVDDFRQADAYEASVAHLPKDKRPPPALHQRDAYCKFGDVVYGRTIWKADDLERFIAKTATLGLGFQMGAPKFQMTLAKGVSGPAVYFTLDRCKEIVYAYRRKNYKIEQGWARCGQIIEDMAAGVHGHHGPISWEADTIWLPNGMSLKYPGLKKGISEQSGYEEWSYAAGADGARKKIYGGLLCENIVQALARIIVGSQMLAISKKYRVVMTTHDEVVAHPKTAQAQKCIEFMERCMKTPLPWCLDLPLNAEGGYAPNYSK